MIGISENKLHHILGVARKCYEIAKEEGYDEEFCRKMFMIGWCHDVGYEFSEETEDHPQISVELIEDLVCMFCRGDVEISKLTKQAILRHGKEPTEKDLKNVKWVILNTADLVIDSKGNDVEVEKRLEDIKERYGSESRQYLTSVQRARDIGLI